MFLMWFFITKSYKQVRALILTFRPLFELFWKTNLLAAKSINSSLQTKKKVVRLKKRKISVAYQSAKLAPQVATSSSGSDIP